MYQTFYTHALYAKVAVDEGNIIHKENGIRYGDDMHRLFSIRLQYPQYVSNGDAAVLH